MKQKTAVITGVNGQDGSFLAEYLLELGYKVVGVTRRTSSVNRDRIDHITNNNLVLEWGDVTDPVSISSLLSTYQPEEFYNLAAQSHVGVSFSSPISTQEINGTAVMQLMHIAAAIAPECRIYNAATSELFGGQPGQAPQSEQTEFYPKSPYGVSKLTAYWATVNARESSNLFAVNGILFNHESERRGHNFVTKKAASAIAEIATGHREKVSFGNINAVRDWGLAPEYVEAMHLMLNNENPQDFVIGTGIPMSVREFISACFEVADIDVRWVGKDLDEKLLEKKTGRVLVDINSAYFRPAEVETLIADPSKASDELGWKAKTHTISLVKRMMEFEFNRINKNYVSR